jgi:hypothetical protein
MSMKYVMWSRENRTSKYLKLNSDVKKIQIKSQQSIFSKDFRGE